MSSMHGMNLNHRPLPFRAHFGLLETGCWGFETLATGVRFGLHLIQIISFPILIISPYNFDNSHTTDPNRTNENIYKMASGTAFARTYIDNHIVTKY